MIAQYRRDLDGVRAIAVLAVCLLHIGVPWMRGGFIGVDIFFVLSGYLITGIVLRGLDKGDFTFVDFYVRRINRIIPALLCLLGITWLAGWAILTLGFKTVGLDIFGGASFVSNVILWSDSHAGGPERALGHLWSLGVEEQFYLVWPALLIFAKRKVRWMIAAIIVVSFIENVFLVRHSQAHSAFYLPFPRMWEILAGGLLYHVERTDDGFGRILTLVKERYADVMSVAGAGLIALTLVIVREHTSWPGIIALLPVTGSVLLIGAGENAILNRTLLSHRLAVGIGLISYPLYLIHWPMIVFTRIVFGYRVPMLLTVALLPIATILAAATFHYVERPIRYGRRRRRSAFLLLLALIGAASLGFATYKGFIPPRHHAQSGSP